jgi:hypothetical protein
VSTLSVNTIKDVQNFDFSNTPFLGAFTTANSGYVVVLVGAIHKLVVQVVLVLSSFVISVHKKQLVAR